MDRKEHKTSYIKWIVLFISLYAIIIAIGIWASQRDAQREAESKEALIKAGKSQANRRR